MALSPPNGFNLDSNDDLMNQKSLQLNSSGVIRLSLLLIGWFMLRFLEFWSGFVEYSHLRLLMALVLSIAFLIPFRRIISLRWNDVLVKMGGGLDRVLSRKIAILGILVILSLMGYALFFSRYQRGADLGDIPFFRQSVETTASFTGLLYNDAVKGSQLFSHSNFFLLLFVPLVWMFGKSGWLIMQYVESLAIVGYCYAGSYAVGELISKRLWGWFLTVALFLATYRYHVIFHDTQFAALGVAIFSAGIVLEKRRVYLLGFLFSLLTRETAVISIVGLLLLLPRKAISTRDRWALILIGLVYYGFFVLLAFQRGGDLNVGRFNPNIFHPEISFGYAKIMWENVANDFPLKLAYTIRVLSFSPFALLSLATWGGMGVDLLSAWLSRDYAIYNIAWDYYIPILPIIVVFGFYEAKRRWNSTGLFTILLKWTLVTCLWQFVTTFHPRLF